MITWFLPLCHCSRTATQEAADMFGSIYLLICSPNSFPQKYGVWSLQYKHIIGVQLFSRGLHLRREKTPFNASFLSQIEIQWGLTDCTNWLQLKPHPLTWNNNYKCIVCNTWHIKYRNYSFIVLWCDIVTDFDSTCSTGGALADVEETCACCTALSAFSWCSAQEDDHRFAFEQAHQMGWLLALSDTNLQRSQIKDQGSWVHPKWLS